MTTRSEDLRRELLEKLPTTGTKGEVIFLGVPFFKQLTDLEFTILWEIPNLNIVIGPNGEEYIEARRKKLKLKFGKNSGYNLGKMTKK